MVDVDDEVARGQPLEDVARDDPAHRLGPADADRAEQLAVGDEHQPVGAADEPAVEAPLDEGDRAGRRRGVDPADGGDRTTGFAQQLGQPGGLVGGEDDPLAVRRPSASTASTIRPARSPGTLGSRQPNRSPELSPPPAIASDGSDSQVSSSVRAPSSRDFQSRGGRYVAGQSFGRSPAATRSAWRSSAWRHRNAPDSARSPGSSRTRSVPGPTWSSPVAGQTIAAQTSAASPASSARVAGATACVTAAGPVGRGPVAPGSMPSKRARSAASRSGNRPAARPRRARSSPGPPDGDEELAGRQERGALGGPDGPLVGRVEPPDRVDLVAEEVDPDRERLAGREDVDDPAAPGELAAAGDLERRAGSRGRAARGGARRARSACRP